MIKQISNLHKIGRMNFCVYEPYLHPERHINMSHNPQNTYEEIIVLGDYPITPVTNDKVPSRKYEEVILKEVFNYLKSKNLHVKLSEKNYADYQFDNWSAHGIDFEAEKSNIVEHLSRNIFVNENKFRYLKEQQNRLQFTAYYYNQQNMNDYFIGHFVETYIDIIKLESEKSNLFRAPKIAGQTSPIEQMYNRRDVHQGPRELLETRPENQSYINKLMFYIHS